MPNDNDDIFIMKLGQCPRCFRSVFGSLEPSPVEKNRKFDYICSKCMTPEEKEELTKNTKEWENN